MRLRTEIYFRFCWYRWLKIQCIVSNKIRSFFVIYTIFCFNFYCNFFNHHWCLYFRALCVLLIEILFLCSRFTFNIQINSVQTADNLWTFNISIKVLMNYKIDIFHHNIISESFKFFVIIISMTLNISYISIFHLI